MTETDETKTDFAGTYFDRDVVMGISRWAGILSWVVLGVYTATWLVSISQVIIQFTTGVFLYKGINPVDVAGIFTPYLLQPMPGILYFFALQAISQILLVLMDMEDNTRRAARK
jgi:hypothetical protein